MNRLRLITFFMGFIVFCASIYAQQDTLSLSEITITEKVLKDFSTHQNVKVISSQIKNAIPIGLTQILQTESAISFRENGKGMVASPAFRGTTASQTAVIWNGIQINSTLLGQVDFNLLNASDFQDIVVKSGGSSALFGTNAIGGSIHLNSKLNFNQTFNQNINVLGGSFDTYHVNHQMKIGGKNTAFQSSVSYNQSQNDYPYIGFDNKNENGQFQNLSTNLSFVQQLSDKLKLNYYAYLFNGFRHFSGTLASIGRNKYKNLDSRQLIDLSYQTSKGKIWQNKLAFLTENFQYFEDYQYDRTSHGDAKTFLFRQEFFNPINDKITLLAQAEYNYQWTEGSSIRFAERHIGSLSSSVKYQFNKSLDVDFALRKEKSSIFSSPFLYSFQTKWQPKSYYALRLVHSKNFRMPTFNDLFWPISGNVELKPEESLQFDLSQDLFFRNGQLTLTYFHNQMTDMIRWEPNQTGFWQPINTQSVEINGFESKFRWQNNYNQLFTRFDLQYSYTSSKDLTTQKQLVYIPFHRFTTQLFLNYKSWDLNYQFQFNGHVFTNASHSDFLKEHAFSNVFLSYHFVKYVPIKIQFQIMNMENKFYQNVINRPMPGRHFNVVLNFKFN